MSKTTTKQVLAEHQAAADWENEGPDPLEEQQEQQDETDFANAKAGAQSRELAPTMPPLTTRGPQKLTRPTDCCAATY